MNIELKPFNWLDFGDRGMHSCGHVFWAHWKNGSCAHCSCTSDDVRDAFTSLAQVLA